MLGAGYLQFKVVNSLQRKTIMTLSGMRQMQELIKLLNDVSAELWRLENVIAQHPECESKPLFNKIKEHLGPALEKVLGTPLDNL
jgi:hypothetical protein